VTHNARRLLISYYIPEEEIVAILRQTGMLDELQWVLVKCTLARPNIIRKTELHHLGSGLLSVRSEGDNARDLPSCHVSLLKLLVIYRRFGTTYTIFKIQGSGSFELRQRIFMWC